jgi:exonuclease SbcD
MKIIHFAAHHLGVESYGRLDPATGLSSRLNDFLAALDQLVSYALEEEVDLVLFCGDAYKSREPSQTQQREFARRVNRLASSGIAVFLLIGNHDLPNAVGRATSTEIFDTLAVSNVYVASHPDVYRVPTRAGDIQVATLPWLRRSALLSREDARDLDLEQINQRLQQALTGMIARLAERLDGSLPAVLAAHVWVAPAMPGSEKTMTLGQEHTLLLSNVANPAFDYVALGHIHRHQVLSEAPPTVYPGSLERIDFGEEADEKGFYVVDIVQGADGGRQVSFRFHPVRGRRFLTISLLLERTDPDPTSTVVEAITARASEVPDAVVRIQLTMPAELEGQLRDAEVRHALKNAHYFTVAKDIRREARLRLGQWAAEEISPIDALKAYLEQKKVPPERAKVLMEYGERLIRGEGAAPDNAAS